MFILSAIFAVSLVSKPNPMGAATCAIAIPEIREFLERQRPWRIVTATDIVSDDVKLWNMYHKGKCPGFSSAHIQGKDVYAIALYREDAGQIHEKLVLWSSDGKSQKVKVISNSQELTSPFVVWQTGPGKFTDSEENRTISLHESSFVYEKMESISYLYYFQNGRIRRIITSE